MNILVFNCGSSSLNFKLFSAQATDLAVLASGKAHRVGVQGTEPAFIEFHRAGHSSRRETPIPNHRQAAGLVTDWLAGQGLAVDAVGHRFVHGGAAFSASTLLTPETLPSLQQCLPLAPIHNPNSMSVIEACAESLPDTPQYVTFDTAFHAGLPPEAYRYALPAEIEQQYGLRKFGFHGLSYQYVTQVISELLGRPLQDLCLIACHLGTGGSSVVAVQHGLVLDTSMGYSPLAGLLMSTRTGDLDSLIPLYLIEQEQATIASLNRLFNKDSGLLGISGFSSDLRDLQRSVGEDPRAALAVKAYVRRLKAAIGAYAVEMGGLDVLIFTDDIGAQNAAVRQVACQGMQWCGIQLDENANATAPKHCPSQINTVDSKVHIFCMPTDEELVIGREGLKVLQGGAHA